MDADLDLFEIVTNIQTYLRRLPTIQHSRPNPLVRASKIAISVWDYQMSLLPMVRQLRYKLQGKSDSLIDQSMSSRFSYLICYLSFLFFQLQVKHKEEEQITRNK